MNGQLPFLMFFLASSSFAQSARDYYNELHAAGGLDQIVSHWVCFDDRKESENFFLFTESKVIREVMMSDGSFSRAPKILQDSLKKDFLFFRGYNKGVPLAPEEEYSPDGTAWISHKFMLDKQTPARVRFEISWETLRYKRSVEILNTDGGLNEQVSVYGRCDLVDHQVRQRGK
jgi:hypothetical protein